MAKLAEVSRHFTPASLQRDLRKLNHNGLDILAVHIKSAYRQMVIDELNALNIPKLGVMEPGMPADRAADMLLAMRHGLIAEHVAKHRVRPGGTHRFRGLIADVVAMLRKAWSPQPGEGMPGAPGLAERGDGSRAGEGDRGSL